MATWGLLIGRGSRASTAQVGEGRGILQSNRKAFKEF